jgi:diguanylate cyclase (GGDEF)-like protein/PAS domain S-box-containing protein
MQWQMTIAIASVFAVVILSFGWISLGNVRAGYEQVGEFQVTLTQRAGMDADRLLQASLDALSAIGGTLAPDNYGKEESAARWLDSRVGTKTTFFDSGLFLFDPRGRLLAASSSSRAVADRAELRRWVVLALKLDEPLIGLPFRNDPAAIGQSASLLLPMAVPFYAPDGRIAGVLAGIADLSRESLLGSTLSTRFGRSGYAFVTAWDGSVLSHPDGGMLLRRDVSPLPTEVIQAATLGARGPMEAVDVSGTQVLATFVKMQATGWVLGINRPTSEAYAQLHGQQRAIVLFMILGSLAAAAATWFLMRFFVAPMKRLSDYIGDVDVSRNVNLDPTPVPRESIEVARLGRSFNELIARLNEDRERSHIADCVFKNVREGILVTDRNGRIVSCNRAFEEISGYSATEARGLHSSVLKSGRHDQRFYRQMWQSLAVTRSWRGEVWNRRKNGDVFPALVNISAAADGDGEIDYYVGIFSDITEMVNQKRRLETLATTDPLTGVPNRALLIDRLKQDVAQAKRQGHLLVVAFIDLDGFKEVNDRQGHHVGDLLLIEVAQRFLRELRLGDTIARLGGDEFVLLLTNVSDQESARGAVQRMLDSIAAPYFVDDKTLVVSASIGVAIYPLDDVDPDTLLRHADHAMYQAKSLGRARIHFFDPVSDRDIQSRHQLAEEIREGIRKGELLLHYQPKVDMLNHRVVGVEALLRWRHPLRGLLYPGQFIDEVASHDVVVEIGEWVIAEACHQMEVWRRDNEVTLPVSVNLAARHLAREGFGDALREAIRRHPDIRPEWLEIEILESDTLQDPARMERAILECQSFGVKFALDDFGTGYSSLSHLKNMPVDGLKIDRSFVINMLASADDLALVEGVVRLAYVFRREVIAEGVETEGHMEILKNMGCYLGQGYGFARPMPAAEVVPWIRGYRPASG